MGTHSSILAWEIPCTEEPGGATVHGVAESDTTYQPNNNNIATLYKNMAFGALYFLFYLSLCPSQTRLKQLSMHTHSLSPVSNPIFNVHTSPYVDIFLVILIILTVN